MATKIAPALKPSRQWRRLKVSEIKTMICNGVRDDGSCAGCGCDVPHEEVVACGMAMTCDEAPTGEVRCVEYKARKEVSDD